MICRGGVVMVYVLNLASDDDDSWLTSRPPWLPVPLIVDFILYQYIYDEIGRYGHVLVFPKEN